MAFILILFNHNPCKPVFLGFINMRILFGFLLIVISTSSVLQADYALRWSPTSGSSSGGTAINVDLFLDESNPDTNLVNYGAVGASYKVNLSGVGTLQTPVGNPNFDLVDTSGSTPTQGSLQQTSILGLTSAGGSLKIGSFVIDPTVNGNGSLTALLFGSAADFSIYNNAFIPQIQDGVLFPAPTFNYNFTAVPEPTSIGAISAIAGFRILRRRKRKVEAEDANRWSLWRRRQRRRSIANTPKYSAKTGAWS